MRRFNVLLFLAAALAPACSDPEATQLFTSEQAVAAARGFQTALEAGDADALAKLCKAPFRFQDRTWDTPAEVAANWKKEIVRVRHLVKGFDSFGAHSRYDLRQGRWPRNETVEEEKREDRITKLGVAVNGWVVRVHAGVKPGYKLVLNAEGVSTLLAQSFDI